MVCIMPTRAALDGALARANAAIVARYPFMAGIVPDDFAGWCRIYLAVPDGRGPRLSDAIIGAGDARLLAEGFDLAMRQLGLPARARRLWPEGAAVSRDAADGCAEVSGPRDRESGPRSWAAFPSPEEAAAWIAAASEEELGAMAEWYLEDRPASREEHVLQHQISLAVIASERSYARVIDAAQAAKDRRARSRRRVSARESRT